MEEIFELMTKYYQKTGRKVILEVLFDGSGGFESEGITIGIFDDIHSICEAAERMCEKLHDCDISNCKNKARYNDIFCKYHSY